jgi:hypothetical protein
MKIGDLVKMPDCPTQRRGKCPCFFCNGDSSRIGVITGRFVDSLTGQVLDDLWKVHFDIGQWEIMDYEFDTGEAELLYEDR